MMMRLRSFLKQKGGNALVELAIGFGILFPVLSGTAQFGYALYIYNEMQTAMRGAARYASLRSYDSSSSTPSTAYQSAIQNVAVYGDPAGGSTPVVPGLATSNVVINVVFRNGVPREVTLGIENYRTSAIVSMVDFNQKPHVTVPYVGAYVPTT